VTSHDFISLALDRSRKLGCDKVSCSRILQIAYGGVVRGPDELSLPNPGLLKSIYGHGIPILKTDSSAGGSFTGVDNLSSKRRGVQYPI
jgi:hypothetical protein